MKPGYIFIIVLLQCLMGFSCQEQLIMIEERNEDDELINKYFLNRDSVQHGESLAYFDGENIFERSFYLDGQLEGKRTIYFKNGQTEIEENYLKGELQDTFKVYHSNGQVELIGQYTNGVLDGVVKKYSEGGSLLEEVSFLNNIENGPFTEYYENGNKKWRGIYLNGDSEFGELLKYNEDGILIRKMMCDSQAVCRTTWTIEEIGVDN